MPVSTSASWNLDADGIIEMAWSRIRRVTGKQQSGHELKHSIRCLQLLMAELNMRGVQLWSIEEWDLPLAEGDATLWLAEDVHDVLDVAIRENGVDLPLPRASRQEMLAIPDKSATGRPLRYWVDRGRERVVLRFWPVPDRTGYTLIAHVMLTLRDVAGMTDNIDVPARWLPAIVSGLAWFVARGTEGMSTVEVEQFASEFERDYATAASDDRERTPFRVLYDLSPYTRA